jgi:uncharacterized membrane protein
MGFFDWLGGEDKRGATGANDMEKPKARTFPTPFAISLSLTPFRLNANKSNNVSLNVSVKNITPDPQLVSVDVLLPRAASMGFEPSCINKAYEKRLGEVQPGQTATASISIWANSQTRPAEYEIGVTAFSHYIGYDKVLTYMKTKTRVRAV